MEKMNELNEMALAPTEQLVEGRGMTGTKGFLLGAAATAAGVGVWALIKKVRKNQIRKQAIEIVEERNQKLKEEFED